MVAIHLVERKPDMEKMTFKEYLDGIRDEVNRHIESHLTALDPDQNLSSEVTEMIMLGKRLRAGLAMIIYEALAREDGKREMALDLATALEIAHSASLILDDMLDEDETRRGRPAIHVTKGQKRAMLETAEILSFPYAIVSKYGDGFIAPLSRTHGSMVYGVMKEVIKKPKLPASAIYDEIITRKTGDTFSLSARYGAMTAGCGPRTVELLSSYGLWTGRAMQIANDVTDLRDVMNGKKSSGFGSEILLLRCVVADGLFREFMSDIKAHSVQSIQEKVPSLWKPQALERELSKKLDEALDNASMIIRSIDYEDFSSYIGRDHFDTWMSTFVRIPREIADIMMSE